MPEKQDKQLDRDYVVTDIVTKVYLRAFKAGEIPPLVAKYITENERKEIARIFLAEKDEGEVSK